MLRFLDLERSIGVAIFHPHLCHALPGLLQLVYGSVQRLGPAAKHDPHERPRTGDLASEPSDLGDGVVQEVGKGEQTQRVPCARLSLQLRDPERCFTRHAWSELDPLRELTGGSSVEDDAGELGVVLRVDKLDDLGDGDRLVQARGGRV